MMWNARARADLAHGARTRQLRWTWPSGPIYLYMARSGAAHYSQQAPRYCRRGRGRHAIPVFLTDLLVTAAARNRGVPMPCVHGRSGSHDLGTFTKLAAAPGWAGAGTQTAAGAAQGRRRRGGAPPAAGAGARAAHKRRQAHCGSTRRGARGAGSGWRAGARRMVAAGAAHWRSMDIGRAPDINAERARQCLQVRTEREVTCRARG